MGETPAADGCRRPPDLPQCRSGDGRAVSWSAAHAPPRPSGGEIGAVQR